MSLIPWTYALAGCLTAHINNILIIMHYIYSDWKTAISGYVRSTSIFIYFKFLVSYSERLIFFVWLESLSFFKSDFLSYNICWIDEYLKSPK